MPSFTRCLVLSLILLICSPGQVFCQKQSPPFYLGYVVLTSGDTIRTYIKKYRFGTSHNSGVVTNDPFGKRVVFQRKDVKMYKVEKDIYVTLDISKPEFAGLQIRSMNSEDNLRFTKVHSYQKPLQLYEFEPQSNYGSAGEENQFFLNKHGDIIHVRRKKFRHVMSMYFMDYPRLSKDIFETTYQYYQLPMIVAFYNSWLEQQAKN